MWKQPYNTPQSSWMDQQSQKNQLQIHRGSCTTSNQRETDANYALCVSNGINSSGKYRKYISDNATSILEHNFNQSIMASPHSIKPVTTNCIAYSATQTNFDRPLNASNWNNYIAERVTYDAKYNKLNAEYQESITPTLSLREVRTILGSGNRV